MTVRSPAVLVLLLSTAGCVKFPADAPYSCERDDQCPQGLLCDPDTRLCALPEQGAGGSGCIPIACEDLPPGTCGSPGDGCGAVLSCGCDPRTERCNTTTDLCECKPRECVSPEGLHCEELDDGCGGTLQCGGCEAGFECDAGLCVTCTPHLQNCGAHDYTCGSTTDDCGGTLFCGACAPGETCGLACSCVPAATPCGPGECGSHASACGGAVACGGCSGQEICGGGGVPGVCGCADQHPEVACAGRSCGEVPGCDGPISCPGSCAPGQVCHELGVCVRELRPYCWGPAQPLHTLDALAPTGITGLSAAIEGGRQFLYVSRKDTGGCLFRVEVSSDWITPTGGAAEELDDAIAFACDGPAVVRADNLELFVAVDPYESAEASRRSVDEPWGPLGRVLLPDPAQRGVVLLPDDRTLVYASPGVGAFASRRESTLAGDLSFSQQAEPLALFDASSDRYGLSLGCDGVALLSAPIDGSVHVGQVERTDLLPGEPLRAGPLVIGSELFVDEGGAPLGITAYSETPDCQLLLLVHREVAAYYARRQPCTP